MRKLLAILLLLSASALAQISGAGQIGCLGVPVSGTAWASGTTSGTVQSLLTNTAVSAALVQLTQGSGISAGAVTFQISYDGTNWISAPAAQVLNPSSGAQISIPYTLVASTNQTFLVLLNGAANLRLEVSTTTAGGTVTPVITQVCGVPFNPLSTDSNGYLKVNLLANSFGTLTVSGSGVFEVGPTTGANTATNPFFNEVTDGTNAMGAMANFGTAPGAVKSLNTNTNIFVGGAAVSGSAPIPVSATTAANAKTNPFYVAPSDGTNTITLDPCQVNAGSQALISLTASGQLITGTASKQTYICALDLVTATAQNIALVEGTGTTCGTGTAGMAGGTTAATGWNFAANSGLVKGAGSNWVFKTATAADNVCLLLSSTGQTSGSVRYVQQ